MENYHNCTWSYVQLLAMVHEKMYHGLHNDKSWQWMVQIICWYVLIIHDVYTIYHIGTNFWSYARQTKTDIQDKASCLGWTRTSSYTFSACYHLSHSESKHSKTCIEVLPCNAWMPFLPRVIHISILKKLCPIHRYVNRRAYV